MNISCIYKITSTVHPERFYIGSAVCFRKRKNSHISYLSRNVHHNPQLQNHVNKHGLADLQFEVVEAIDDVSCLIEREQFYIDSLSPFFNTCRTAGNTLGTKRSMATRSIIRNLKLGNQYNAGRRLSDEHRLAISRSNKGRKCSESHRENIRIAALNRSQESIEKYRQSQTGKRLSEETKLKISTASSGANNPRWKGGVSKSYKSRKRKESLCAS